MFYIRGSRSLQFKFCSPQGILLEADKVKPSHSKQILSNKEITPCGETVGQRLLTISTALSLIYGE